MSHLKAPSANTDARPGTTRARRTAFGMVCLCIVALAALLGSSAPSVRAEGSPGPAQRHFERVTPAEKGDGDIVAEGEAITAAKSGDGAAFDSRMGFADSVGSGVVGRTTYVAKRVGDGVWTTHAVTPTPRPETNQVVFAKNSVQIFSDDLSTAISWAYDLPGVSDDTPERMNLYVEDTASRTFRPVSVSHVGATLQLFDFIDPQSAPPLGVSDDAKHLAFATATPMLPEVEPTQNVYKWDDGVLSVVRLPDGKVPTTGSSVVPTGVRGTMSPDGTRLAFLSAGDDGSSPPQLYLDIDGRSTAWVSQPEGSDQSLPGGNIFEGMTPDGKNVFFVSESALLDEDDKPGPDVYRWSETADPLTGHHLALITHTGRAVSDPAVNGGALIGISDDARTAYVHDSGSFISVWHDGVTKIVDPFVPRFGQIKETLGLTSVQPGNGRVSPDGNWLAYINNSQMYVYDRDSGHETCVSCPGGASLVPTLTNAGRLDNATFRPRFLSSDGQVFFTSTGALVPADTNGVADVYEYDGPTGTINLISSGTSTFPSQFADASASGDDVFIVTRNRLVPADRDDYVDLYDVRVGPPLPDSADTAPACDGEACQGVPSALPSGDLPASSTVAGRGNVVSHRTHRKGHCSKRVHRAAKRRNCTHKKGGSKQRAANSNRRAAK